VEYSRTFKTEEAQASEYFYSSGNYIKRKKKKREEKEICPFVC
jgi:hypothetical protein